MAKSLSPINVAADTMEVLITLANNMVDAFATETLTANTDANGASVTGNSHINGIFSGTTIAVGTLRGGNVQTSTGAINVAANLALGQGNIVSIGGTTNAVINSSTLTLANSTASFSLTKPTAAQISDGNFVPKSDGSWDKPWVSVNETTFADTTPAAVVTYNTASYHAGEFTVYVNDTTANGKHFSKILTLFDGTDVDFTEYAVIQSNGSIGSFSANVSGTNVRLFFTPTAATSKVSVIENLVSV